MKFVDEYLKCLNIGEAAIAAGYSAANARNIGWITLQRPHVQAYLEQRRVEIAAAVGITPETVVTELARIALADVRDVVNWDAHGRTTVTASKDLSDDAARSISSFSRDRKGVVKVRHHNKNEALDKLARIFGQYAADKNGVGGALGVAKRLAEARERRARKAT